MSKVAPQTYCVDCHCVIPVGWPRVNAGDGWRCVVCDYERETGKPVAPATNVGHCGR